MKYQEAFASLAVAIAFMGMQVLFGCGPSSRMDSTALPTLVPTQSAQPTATIASVIVTGSGAGSYVTAKTIEQLAIQSKVIVIGSLLGLGETINMARNVNDITQADPNILIVGQIYHIGANHYLKGSGPSTIDVVQSEAHLFSNTPKTQENINAARVAEHYIAIRSATQYLFFLEPFSGFADKNYWVGVRHPWRFVLVDNGNAAPESPWQGAAQVFPSRPSIALIGEVEFWVNGGKSPTSTPGPINTASPAFMPTSIPITPAPNATRKSYP